VGLVANAQFAQMADFMLGWFGIDFAGDDGRKFGLWPWQTEEILRESPESGPSEQPGGQRGREVPVIER
jgi:hypothetical protein